LRQTHNAQYAGSLFRCSRIEYSSDRSRKAREDRTNAVWVLAIYEAKLELANRSIQGSPRIIASALELCCVVFLASALLRRLSVLELVDQVTSETGAWSSVWVHLSSSTGLHAKDAVPAIGCAGDNHASLSVVSSCGTSASAGNGSLASLNIRDSLGCIVVYDRRAAAVFFQSLTSG